MAIIAVGLLRAEPRVPEVRAAQVRPVQVGALHRVAPAVRNSGADRRIADYRAAQTGATQNREDQARTVEARAGEIGLLDPGTAENRAAKIAVGEVDPVEARSYEIRAAQVARMQASGPVDHRMRTAALPERRR